MLVELNRNEMTKTKLINKVSWLDVLNENPDNAAHWAIQRILAEGRDRVFAYQTLDLRIVFDSRDEDFVEKFLKQISVQLESSYLLKMFTETGFSEITYTFYKNSVQKQVIWKK